MTVVDQLKIKILFQNHDEVVSMSPLRTFLNDEILKF